MRLERNTENVEFTLHKLINMAKIISEEDYVDYSEQTELSYYDNGENYVELYVNNTYVGDIEVWTDWDNDNREYLTINYEIVYLDTIKSL
jgi:hypothetical protein